MKRLLAKSIVFGAIAFAAGRVIVQIGRTPKLARVRAAFQSQDRAILDRNGELIDEIRLEKRGRRLNWVKLESVPRPFLQAIVTAEDHRFYYHPGVDPVALLQRGGRTITLQLVQRIEPQLPPQQQLLAALALELSWNKHDILEAYVNLIPYRAGEMQGIGAASFGLFDKAPSALTRPEAALIVASIHAATLVKARDRACRLLAELDEPEDCGLLDQAHLAALEEGYRIHPYMKLAPDVALRLKKMPELAHGSIIRSTLDRPLQWLALHSLQKQMVDLPGAPTANGAVIVLENKTGNVLAYVGRSGDKATVDAAMAGKPIGPMLQPFIYGKAIDERILTAATPLESFVSQPVTVREALASGLNIPAVRALELLGEDSFVQTLKALGFSDLQRPESYGPSLALGSAEARLLDLTNAYRALANGGTWSQVRFSPQQLTDIAPRPVLSKATAFLVTDMLKPAVLGFWAVSETGTSRDHEDSWCIGFSENYTVGVWTGDWPREQGASEAWREIMQSLHRRQSSEAPRAPEGLSKSGEWFLTDTKPGALDDWSEPPSRISYPRDRALIADTEIPQSNHKLFIQVIAPRPDQNLYLNGKRLGRAQLFLPWVPTAGKYTLELRDSRGQVVDKVRFEVRGRRFAMI